MSHYDGSVGILSEDRALSVPQMRQRIPVHPQHALA